MRALVVGAGVIGCAVTDALSRAGVDVTVCEARIPGAGSSGESYAWVNSNRKEPFDYYALNVAGLQAQHRWSERFANESGPFDRWLWKTGRFEWAVEAEHEEQLAQKLVRMAELGYPVETLAVAEAHRREPRLRIQADVDRVAWFPEEAFISTELMIGTLLRSARARGARLLTRTEVTAVERRDGVVDVMVRDGRRFEVDVVVSCAGRWTSEIAELAGVPGIPMAAVDAIGLPTIGLLVSTHPMPPPITTILTTSHISLRPKPEGGLLLHALDLDPETDPSAVPGIDGPEANELLDRLEQVVELDERPGIARVQVGRRAIPVDGRTVAGFADDARQFYAIATHSGVTLAAALAEFCVEEVVHRNAIAELENFRPDRFRSMTGPVTTPRATVPGDQ
jgi:D-hydroxyproline dehydrogenase subunit beta